MTTEQYSIGYEAGYQEGWNDAQKPQRKPLTDEDMKKIWHEMDKIMDIVGWYSFQDIARAIEAAHGIKEESNDD